MAGLASVGGRGRHEEGREVPARPLRLAPGRGRGPRGSVGGEQAGGGDLPSVAGMSTGPPVGAVDCGSNSTRLLVASGDARPLVRLMRITRLGQGVDATRRLHPDAVARTLAVLREYREVMDTHGVERVRMTATSAARDAENRDDFLGPAADVIGVAP